MWTLGAYAWESKGMGACKAKEAGEQGTREKRRGEHKIIQKGMISGISPCAAFLTKLVS